MTAIVVRPIRFTDNLDEMRSFPEAVGLRPRVESVRGGWVDMVGGDGIVALHSAATATSGARHGETRLGFEAEDVRTVSDEFAPFVRVADPDGRECQIHSASDGTA